MLYFNLRPGPKKAHWIAKHIPHLRMCPLITELSGQKYDRAYERTTTTVHSEWYLPNKKDIRDKYTLKLRMMFDKLQEISETTTPKNFVDAHLEATAECIPSKQRDKPKVPWETLAVRKKRSEVKSLSLCKWGNPTNIRGQKLKKAQNVLTYT